jgi:hypothetical protein
MDDQISNATTAPPADEPIPWLQQVVDNIWLLFAASLVVVLGSYLVWGLIDLLNVLVLP